MLLYDAALLYAGPDLPIVDHIARELRRNGIRLWFDRLIKPEESFSIEKIKEVFSQSRFVVPLLSQHAERSAWVNAELELAFKMQAQVLPCVIGELVNESAAVMQRLRRLPFLDLRAGKDKISDKRLQELADLLLEREAFSEALAALRARKTSIVWFLWPVLALLMAGFLFAGLRSGGPGPATRAADLVASVALAANVFVSLGGVICVVAVLLWGLRHLLETVAARRAWWQLRLTLGDPPDTD